MPSMDPQRLKPFLDDPDRPAGTLRYHELQGFLFTVASAPELVPPSEWLPIIFGEADAGYASLDQAHEILGQIMALYNTINAAVLDPPTLLPKDCPLREAVLANFEDDAPMAQWSRGFLRGHQWPEALWEETVPQELDDELGSILMTLSFFSSREIAEAFHGEAATGGQPFEMTAATIHRVLPTAVAQYAHMGRSIATVRAAPDAEAAEPARRARVGRNDPCPCGSGAKYKKCCGATVH